MTNRDPERRARRIAVLLANNDQSEFSARFPSDADKVCTLLRTQRPEWTYVTYAVKDDVFPGVQDADGYVITGSPASVNEPLLWIENLECFIRDLHRTCVPLVGLCFGHQLIAKALGGRVGPNPEGWRFGVAETQFSALSPWMQPALHRMRLHACHSEQVLETPREATILGGDAFCPVGSFVIGEHIFTTEYHPEFTTEFMKALAVAYLGEVPDSVLDAGVKQLQQNPDSERFAEWMVRFFERSALRNDAKI